MFILFTSYNKIILHWISIWSISTISKSNSVFFFSALPQFDLILPSVHYSDLWPNIESIHFLHHFPYFPFFFLKGTPLSLLCIYSLKRLRASLFLAFALKQSFQTLKTLVFAILVLSFFKFKGLFFLLSQVGLIFCLLFILFFMFSELSFGGDNAV